MNVTPVQQEDPNDPLLNVREAAARANPPMTPSDWRARVARGTAPQPDDPDTDRPPARRRPRWLTSTVDRFSDNATDGRGQSRAGQDAATLEVVKLRQHTSHNWVVREAATGTISSRHRSSAEAHAALASLIT